MKKQTNIILYLLVALLLTSTLSLSACDKEVEASEPVIKTDNKRIFELFREIASTPRTGTYYPEKINQTITSKLGLWGIKPTIDESGNIIVDIPASKGQEDTPLLILQCHTNATITADASIIFDSEREGANPLISDDGGKIFSKGTSMGSSSAVGIANVMNLLNYLTELKNKDFQHGPIRALFIANDGTMNGSKQLEEKYVKDGDIMISFDNVSSNNLVLNSEFAQLYNINEATKSVDPKARRAFAITAYNFPGYRFGEYSSAPKSIEIISEILTKANGAGILFELYSIESSETNQFSPTETTAIVGLNDYEFRRFRQIFNDSSSSFIDEIDSYYIDHGLGITMIETPVPSKAIAQEDVSKILTQLYAFFNTNFNDDDEHRIGVFIENFSANPIAFSADVTVLSARMDLIDSSSSKLQEIAKLSGLSFEKIYEIPGYTTDAENEFALKYFDIKKEITGSEAKKKLRYTANPIGFIAEKNPLMPILTIGVTIKDEGTVNEVIDSSSLAVPSTVILHYISALTNETDSKE